MLKLTASKPDTLLRRLRPTSATDGRLVRRATIAYIIALSLIAMLSGATHFVVDRSISEQYGSATIVNIAGRQRMLSQRIALLATQIELGDESAMQPLKDAAALMAMSHDALIKGNAMGIKHSLSQDGSALYFTSDIALDAKIQRFLSNADIVIRGAAAPIRQQATHDIVEAARGDLLPALDTATTLFNKEALDRVNDMRGLQRLVLATLIITLIAEAFLIFRPLINRLNSYVLRLYERATRDSLTDLPNRRHYMEASHREMGLAARGETALSVIVLDIDYFKIINDTYGHAVGDDALRAFAHVFRDTLRATEIFGRTGGEEFAVTLRGADALVAAGVAERVRAAIDDHASQGVPRMTVSCGVAQLREGETFEALLQRADDQLYVAKHNGRNQVSLDAQISIDEPAQISTDVALAV